ncbi:PIG-L family deacetylase [bacterium]|nr:PIG-L family deacetylase [bacterium]
MSGRNLIVVAHPDDETLFMGGLILSRREFVWDVICTTDADGDGRGDERWEEFQKACEVLGANPLGFLGFPDVFDQRLNVSELKQEIFEKLQGYDSVYTHGPLGEYGHPHHQDTSIAVHEAALERNMQAWSVAYNSKPDDVVVLSKETYAVKLKTLVGIYGQETSRFLNFLNCSYCEAFSQVEISEVRSLYDCLIAGRDFGNQLMPHHGMLKDWVRNGTYQSSVEAFFSHYFETSEND